MTEDFDARKTRAADWFRTLRGQIVQAFEGLEAKAAPAGADPVRFEVTPTTRPDGGGGIMSVLRGGRVFEKVGVNWSAVHGELAPGRRRRWRRGACRGWRPIRAFGPAEFPLWRIWLTPTRRRFT